LLFLMSLLAVGCSDKQDDAAKLEQEMRQMEQGADTGIPAETADTSGVTAPPADVYAVPEEEASELVMPSRPAGSGFAVQVASCEDPEYASHLVQLFSERGYEPYVAVYTIDGQDFYRVRLGLFESKAEADRLKEELVDKYSIEPWVDQE